MTMTQSGPRCDVHGGYILGLNPAEVMHPFRVKGIDAQLLSCEECQPKLAAAFEAADPKLLPDGPLREAFEGPKA